jgi:hypothetical protein
MEINWLDDHSLNVFLLCCAVFRIYLEVVGFNFASLPLTKRLPNNSQKNVHKMGFYLSVGYFILFAPSYLI